MHEKRRCPAACGGNEGMVTLTADTRFPGIFLDTYVPKYKELAER